MGNAVAYAVSDITEDGNAWRSDRVSLPQADDIFGWGFEKEQPSLVVAPMALSKTAFSRSDLSSENSEESSTRDSEAEGGDLSDQSTTHARSAEWPPILPLEDPLKKQPSQLVLQPGPGESPTRQGRWLAATWSPLHRCRALQGRALLTESRLAQLRPHLPLATRFASRWRLIYSPRVHGVSLGTFYRQCQAWPGETLLLVEDTNGAVFGGFASHTWRASRQQLHCGRPECFVFTFGLQDAHRVELTVDEDTKRLGFVCTGMPPQRMVVARVHEGTWADTAGVIAGDELIEVNGQPVSDLADKLDGLMRMHRPLRLTFARRDELALYPWAGGNQHFMFANFDGLSMGGGSNFAFWINKDFLTGTSAASETFANPGPLASSAEFVIRNFECWAFDHSLALSEELECHGFPSTLASSPPASAPRMSRYQRLRQQATSVLRFGTQL